MTARTRNVLEEEGRSLGHRLSALRVECRSFAHAQHNTRTSDHQSSPDPLPGDHTHGACLCALRKRQRQRNKRTRERERPTDRTNGPRGGLASLDRGTERKRVRQVRPMSAYTTCTQRYHRYARGPCTHARVRLVILHTRRPTDKTVFLL